MRTTLRITFILLLGLFVFYILGPKPHIPELTTTLPELNIDLLDVEEYVHQKESQIEHLKENNESQIRWADSIPNQTEYCLLFLHGFSASPEEGKPLDEEVAQRYGCNFYAPRLYGHGIQDDNAFLDMTAEKLLDSAKEALAIAKVMGKKVIIMASSTGGTLGLFMASGNPEVNGLILYSPNIDMADSKSTLLIGPWGLQIARKIFNGTHRGFDAPEKVKKYWTHSYRIEGLIQLKVLLKASMKKTVFEKISQPVFTGYYYKNEEEQDDIVSIPKMKEMHNYLATPEDQQRLVAFDQVGGHVIASKYYSKDIESVRKETFSFCEEVLGMKVR